MRPHHSLLIAALGYSLLPLALAQQPDFKPRSMAYVLQGDSFAKKRADADQKLAGCGRDLVVIDHSYTGGSDGRWTAQEIDSIRKGQAGRKVVAYLSIGEAENYRDYWKKEWERQDAKPAFLDKVNPNWKGNYKVRYWHKDWQKLILAYLDRVIEQGFDGVYLDIVDAFEFYEHDPMKNVWIDHRKNPETGNTYRQDMIAWVKIIAEHARKKKPGFLVIPQNGAQLLENEDYLKLIDAIGIEDLFTDGNKKQPADHTKHILGFLQKAKQANKPVLLIEYGTNEKMKKLSIDGAKQNQLILLLTDRNLKTLGALGK